MYPNLTHFLYLCHYHVDLVLGGGEGENVALMSGLQGALWELGDLPEVVRTDNLSAATHELKDSRGHPFTERYRGILDHYGLRVACCC